MGFSKQECWSGLPFPSPGDLPDPGIEPRSPALQADALTSEPPGKQYLITSWEIDGETVETVSDFIFLGSKITADGDLSHEIKMLAPWKKTYDQTRQHIEKHRHYFARKGPSSQGYGFSSSHVWM